MGKAVNFWMVTFRVCRDSIINFTSQLLFDSLFTCRLKDVALVVFHLCF